MQISNEGKQALYDLTKVLNEDKSRMTSPSFKTAPKYK